MAEIRSEESAWREPRYFVVAYNHNYYLHWCRQHGIRPQGGNVRYLSDPYQARGAEYHLILVSSWWENKDWYFQDEIKYQVIPRATKVYEVSSDIAIVANDDGHIIHIVKEKR